MNLQKYHGVFPAFYACYEDDGSVSLERSKKLARHLIDKGVKGLYVGGSSGECIYLNKEERKAALEAVMEEIKGECTVIAHVACNNTQDSCELAAHAESLGVDAIASIPPIYFRLPEYSIAAYWNAISEAAPNTDFVIYNIPQLAGVALTPSLFKEMRKNPRVIGVKNSSMPAYDLELWKRLGGKNCVIFNGPDEQFVAGRVIGASGGIGGTYAVMPELFLKMDELIYKGDMLKAEEIQHEVNRIIEEMCSSRANMYAVAKKIIEINEGFSCGSVRAPLTPLSKADLAVAEQTAKHIQEAIAKFIN
ncbi:MAG: dihydrodipicolinate synthase family protein [Christensenellales bacterium]